MTPLKTHLDAKVTQSRPFVTQFYYQTQVGQERFELSTSRLSGVRSNQLSYWPLLLGPA